MDFASQPLLADAFQQHAHRGRADDGVFDQQNPLVFEDFAQGGVLGLRALLALGAPLNEGAAAVAVADQAFQARHAEAVGHRVGGGFARIRHGDNDRILVDRQGLHSRQLFAEGLARHVNAAAVERAGDVRKIDPLEETVGMAGAVGETLDLQFAVGDRDRLARQQRLDAFRGESEIQQRHAFAGGGEQRPVDGIAERLDAERVPRDEHVAQGVEEDEAVGAVRPIGDLAAEIDQRGPAVLRQRLANHVHEDFGVRLRAR